jgi:orotidine-5'-phosphate decarboxylase
MNDPLRPRTPEERLIVALDLPSAGDAIELAKRLGDRVVWVKVGLELFCSAGPPVVEGLAAIGKKIFLDLKFHDIPNTVAGAVSAVARLPVHLVNMHAASGPDAMRAAREAVAGRTDLGLLAVTRLTSQAAGARDFSDCEAAAQGACAAGFYGVVCPAQAASRLRERFGERLAYVVPGIRPAGSGSDDQVHIATPQGAVTAGADWIVVGRPITRASDPAAAAHAIQLSLASGQARSRGI